MAIIFQGGRCLYLVHLAFAVTTIYYTTGLVAAMLYRSWGAYLKLRQMDKNTLSISMVVRMGCFLVLNIISVRYVVLFCLACSSIQFTQPESSGTVVPIVKL